MVDGNEEVRLVTPAMPSNSVGAPRFFLIGEIEEELLDKFVGPFTQAIDEQAERKKPDPLTIYVQGPGGYYDVCTTILSLMKVAQSAGLIVRTVVTGEVASASSIIAVAGSRDYRFIHPMAEHMLHYGWISGEGETPTEIDRSNERAKRFFRGVAKHYEDNCEIPNLSKSFQYDQFYIPARQCIQWKLADHMLDKLIV